MVYSLRNCLLSLPDRLNSSFCPLLLLFCFVEEHPDKVGSVSYSRLEIATINIICFFNDCVYVLYLHHKTIKNSLFFLNAFLLIHDDKILLLQIACTAIHRLNINRQSMILPLQSDNLEFSN